MKSYEQRKEELVKDIIYAKGIIPNRVMHVTKEGLSCYYLSSKTFGRTSRISKESLLSIREMQKIGKVELRLFHFILSNIDQVNLDSAEEVSLRLDKLSERTYNDYLGVLTQIRIACDTKDEGRKIKPLAGIDSVLTNENYSRMVIGLMERLKDIKNFLNYEPEFWETIKPWYKEIPVNAEGAKHECAAVAIKDDAGNISIVKAHVPIVTDFETALIALDVIKKAHDYYLAIGTPYDQYVKKTSNEETTSYKEMLSTRAQRITKK